MADEFTVNQCHSSKILMTGEQDLHARPVPGVAKSPGFDKPKITQGFAQPGVHLHNFLIGEHVSVGSHAWYHHYVPLRMSQAQLLHVCHCSVL